MENKQYKKYVLYVDQNSYPDIVQLLDRCPKATRSDLIIKGIKLLIESGLAPLFNQQANNTTVNPSNIQAKEETNDKGQVIDLSNIFD
jgi:hypothetical protein